MSRNKSAFAVPFTVTESPSPDPPVISIVNGVFCATLVLAQTRDGRIVVNVPVDYLVLTETLAASLDRAEAQVEIEAKIVQTGTDTARALGVQWGVNGRMSSELGNTSPLAFPAHLLVGLLLHAMQLLHLLGVARVDLLQFLLFRLQPCFGVLTARASG